MSEQMPGDARVGLVGLGNMGRGLANSLLSAGFPLSVFDLNSSVVVEFEDRGAKAASNLPDLLSHSDIILTCLPSLESIQAVYEGPEGIFKNAQHGTTVVDFSTSNPELTRKLGRLLGEKNIDLVDAPMLRNPKAAWDGNLQLLVSGSSEAIDRVKPILSAVSEDQLIVGDLGNAHGIKIINNAVTIANGAILCEVFTLARKIGIDLNLLYEVLDRSSASSKKLHITVPDLINSDHTPVYSINLCLKDIELFMNLASEIGANSPISEQVHQLFKLAEENGFGSEDNTRIATVLEKE